VRETIINDGLIEMSVSLKFLSERIILRVSVKYGDHRFACLRTKDSEKKSDMESNYMRLTTFLRAWRKKIIFRAT